ncbi:hypothetical protein EGW08_003485 [Elysia chlorotica]|uniref:tRNA:m(4)X modification enzyme TRM13 n=1 Tax=Elysia chlorotica TaxID=188477 RepID=A0A3S1HYQ2_ELYCH|nr:hypothetical protein EGW08_003485 [Elysia chlorotica]
MEITQDDKKGYSKSAALNGDGDPLQCKFYLKKKSRLCRFKPKWGQDYCPEHACLMGIQSERKRIPCPLNPKHNCYEDELDKHIRKCNITKIQQKVEKEVYYVKSINKGSGSCCESLPSKTQIPVKDMTSKDLADIIERVTRIYNAHVEPIQSTYIHHPCVRNEICSSEQEDLSSVLTDQVALRKELLQQAALVGQMEKEKFLDLEDNYFVELGAGKGKLSHWIRKACHQRPNSKFLLVERGSVRYKVDRHQQQNQGENNFKRIKMDIEDLCLGKVPGLDSVRAITVVGKHLCGGATDMGIRCAVNTLHWAQQKSQPSELSQSSTNPETNMSDEQKLPESSETFQSSRDQETEVSDKQTLPYSGSGSSLASQSVSELDHGQASNTNKDTNVLQSSANTCGEPPVKIAKIGDLSSEAYSERLPDGIMIALCCHHQCTWDTYVGRKFMELCGLGPEEFDLLTRLSSWATCARVRARSNTKPRPGLEVDTNSNKSQDQTDTTENLNSKEEVKEDHFSEDLINLAKNSNLSLREHLTVPEREKIGRQCKRIIDTGRLHYLRSKGMQASLREYIDEDTTPENVVLVAYPKL